MRLFTSGLAGLFVGTLILAGLPNGSPLPRARAAVAAPSQATAPQAQGSGAVAERERARSLLRQGKAAEALLHLEVALAQFRQTNDKSGEASTLDLLGELYERQGRYDIALRHFDDAYKIYNQLALSESRQSNLVAAVSTQEGAYNANLMLAKTGQMHYRRGDIQQARAAFSRMRVTKPETDMLKAAQGGKSNAESKARKVTGFGSRMRGVLSGRPTISTPGAAADVVADTASTFKAPFNAYRETVIYVVHELGMGRVDYFNDQHDAAKKHFENVLAATVGSLPVVGKLGQTRRYRTAARTALGDIAFKQARYADAVKLYNDAEKGAREDARLDLAWPAQRGTGRSLWAQAAAERDEKKALKLREDALGSYREALSTIETIRRGSLRADEARTTFLATTEEVFDEAAAALAEMALGAGANAANPNAPVTSAPLEGRAHEYAAEALSVVEQGRARSLLDMLSETGSEITEGVPSDLLQRKQENQARQEEIAAQLTGVNLGGEGPQKSLEDLEAELGRLQVEFESIENQIRSASPKYAALTAARPLSLADIRQQVLDAETTLLEYSLGEERSYLYAVTRDALTVSRLPARAEIEKQAVALRQQIIPASLRRALTDTVAAATDPQRGLTVSGGGGGTQATPAAVSSYASVAHALYKTVVEPAAPLLKTNRLLVVADGALNYVPFDALVTEAPAAGADFSTLAYLLKTNESIVAPSASVVAVIRQQRAGTAEASRAGGGILLVADPVFDERDARARGSAKQTAAGEQVAGAEAARGLSFESALADVSQRESAGGAPAGAGKGGVLVRLAGTREEAQQISRLAAASGRKADTWLDLDASESNIEERDLRQYRVLHFATHGLLNAERPQFTGVVLSLVGNNAGMDGFLRTDEVFNLRLSSPLVMLSACETGLGREKRGEGVIGLTRAFMYAGSPTVGVSLWSVADKSTAELMTDFYKHLLGAQGLTPSAAMRAARRNMIAGKKYSAPFYWAPFVLNGDWR
ncbi:MAG TPA: CHAT domain-containing tetratricopeptide repeat protein [Pyrinomonadaceae bacterium]|nr:CHAT domain-containing tetratricopeptide repeat protein [Pyrinomonadaceae bacterium]